MSKYLRLFAHNQLVSGRERGALYDLQSGAVRVIPNALLPLLQELAQRPIRDVANAYFAEDPSVLDAYLNFLTKEDFAFYTDHPERFPPLDLDWDTPFALTSALVAHDHRTAPYDLVAVLAELDAIGTEHLELQLYGYPPSGDAVWEALGAQLRRCEFRRTVLYTDLGDELDAAFAEKCFATWPRLAHIVSLGAEKEVTDAAGAGDLTYTDRASVKALAETIDREQLHIVTSEYFREALQFNPYFNRRVAIDERGAIRNDLLHAQTVFGTVPSNSIAATVAQDAFQRLWRARPDTIRGYRDSPLRYCLPYDRPLTWDAEREEWFPAS